MQAEEVIHTATGVVYSTPNMVKFRMPAAQAGLQASYRLGPFPL